MVAGGGGGGGTEPTLSIADAAASEGDPAEFIVTLSTSSTRTVTVDYATAGGTAEEGADYTPQPRAP